MCKQYHAVFKTMLFIPKTLCTWLVLDTCFLLVHEGENVWLNTNVKRYDIMFSLRKQHCKRLEKVDIRYENCTIVIFKEIWARNTYIYTYDSYHYMEWLTRGYKKRDAHKVVGVYLQAYIIILSHIGIMRAQLWYTYCTKYPWLSDIPLIWDYVKDVSVANLYIDIWWDFKDVLMHINCKNNF